MAHIINRTQGLALLREKASPNAHHDGEHLAGPTKCDPDTRVAIIDDIVSFIRNPATTKPVLWLNGAAGTGKSAIALSVAAKCQELGILAATFMFWDTDASRNSLEHFVSTIADQIATNFPIIGKHIDRVVSFCLPSALDVVFGRGGVLRVLDECCEDGGDTVNIPR